MRTLNILSTSILTNDELYFLRGGTDNSGPGDDEDDNEEIEIVDGIDF
jgi:hypothetical protein